MKKNKVKLKRDLELALFASVLILLVVLGIFRPSYLGYTTYQIENQEKTWDFTNLNEYLYNSSLINLEDGARLIPEINTIKINNYSYEDYYIANALYDSEDKTSKLISVDNEIINADKSKKLNVIFDHELNNNGVISMYIKESDESYIYLCDYNLSCNSPGYGLVNYNGNDGRHNLTVSGLINPIDRFNIDPDHVKIDYIYAYRFINNSYNIENITYPISAVIDTKDFTVNDFGKWDLLTIDKIGEVEFYYSIDSGNSWNLINDFNLSYVNSNIIRIRANLTQEDILNSLSLKYTTSVACQEDWNCASWEPEICPRNETQNRVCVDLNECESYDQQPALIRNCSFNCVEKWELYYSECGNDDTKLIYYTDEERCGTLNNLPSDNGSAIACDYCMPNWVCVAYNSCNINLKQKQCNEIVDANYCYELTGLDFDNIIPDLSESCTEFTSNTIAENNTLNYNFYYNDGFKLNLELNNSDISANIEVKNTITNGTISITNYKENIKGKSVDLGLKYFEINASNDIENNINSNKIKIYYTDEEINNKDIDEDTLKIYYYNESNEWQELNSSLNKTGKYIEVTLDHLSYYGVFGQEKTQPVTTTSSGGGGGGGGSSSGGGFFISKQKEEKKEKEIIKEEESYEIETSIENDIDFVNINKYRFDIKNKGDKIDRIELYSGNKLVRISQPIIENFEENGETELLLVTDSVLTRNKPNLLASGFAAKTVEQQIKDVSAEFTILGMVNNSVVVNKTIPVTMKLVLFDKIEDTKFLPYNMLFISFIIAAGLLLIWNFSRNNKKEKETEEEVNRLFKEAEEKKKIKEDAEKEEDSLNEIIILKEKEGIK